VENEESTPQMKISNEDKEALKTLEDELQAQDIKEVKPDKGVKIAQKSTG
jgi:hypothetical protein